jgi:hydroxymethylpyrimidine/phosphomethylpyrimidine kinase
MTQNPDDVHSIPVALTIAGSDPTGGAGIQADLKVFSAMGVYGGSVISCLTFQTTSGVQDILPLPFEVVRRQLECVFDDVNVDAVKVGMLGTEDIVRVVARILIDRHARNIVVDPVLEAKNGPKLLDAKGIVALKEVLIPLCTLLTPNVHEAEALTGIRIGDRKDIEAASEKLHALGAPNALIKGGHLPGEESVDYLSDGRTVKGFKLPTLPDRTVHGTGCTLSSAIAALLAKGATLEEAVEKAKAYTHRAIENALKVGKGNLVPWHGVSGDQGVNCD